VARRQRRTGQGGRLAQNEKVTQPSARLPDADRHQQRRADKHARGEMGTTTPDGALVRGARSSLLTVHGCRRVWCLGLSIRSVREEIEGLANIVCCCVLVCQSWFGINSCFGVVGPQVHSDFHRVCVNGFAYYLPLQNIQYVLDAKFVCM
jgi:hypothetical protein